MSDWYEDEQVRFPVPPRMRVKRLGSDATGTWYEIKTGGHKACAILSISRSPGVSFVSARLQAHVTLGDFDSEHVRTSRVRASLAEGFSQWQESAVENFVKRNSESTHQSYLTSQTGELFVELSINGSGDYRTCIAIWREFLEGLMVKDIGVVAAPGHSKEKSRNRSPRDGSRRPAPPSIPLPSSLDYLKPAIDVLARRTIADLEAGAADPTPLLEALDVRFAQTKGTARRDLLTAAANELQSWAEALAAQDRKWAYAGGHAVGVLRYAAENVTSGSFC